MILLNDDLVFNGLNWLGKLVEAFSLDKTVGIVGCRLRYPDGRIQHAGTYITPFGLPDNYKNDRKSGYVTGVIGAAFMVRKAVLDRIGLLDEIYLPFLEEEIDFCERARSFGYRTYYVKDVDITHLEGKSVFKTKMKNNWTPEQREYIFARNNFIFLLRWHRLLVVPNLAFRTVLPLFGGVVATVLKRTKINYRFSTVIPAFKEALAVHRKERIPRLYSRPRSWPS
jgi:GT2 family glycosyltransferase